MGVRVSQLAQAINLFQMPRKISFTFHFWYKSFILDDVKPEELSNNSFEWKNVAILGGGVKTYSDPSYIFSRVKTQFPGIYPPDYYFVANVYYSFFLHTHLNKVNVVDLRLVAAQLRSSRYWVVPGWLNVLPEFRSAWFVCTQQELSSVLKSTATHLGSPTQ